MADSVFVELKFWLLVLFSLVAPPVLVWVCLTVRAVSRNAVLSIGLLLVAIAGFDFYLLQALASAALKTPSTADDALFDSEVTVGLYVLPALLAGIGINVVSHVLIEHLTDAQRRFARASADEAHAHPPARARRHARAPLMEGSAIAGWGDFFTALAGTAGALVGLVFVSLSINLTRILALPGVAARAGETIVLLAGVLTQALVALMPHISPVHLGWALLPVALVAWATPVVLYLKALASHTLYKRSLGLIRIGLNQLATVPGLVAVACLLGGHAGGMAWLAVGAIASILVAIFSAWVLMVEIMR